jgi:hypothetical protein
MSETELNDKHYNKEEFDVWFRKLMNVDFPCFYRDILRAEKKTLWNRFKLVADEYDKDEK